MVTTLSLNPCVDKSICIGEFRYGGLNRVLDSREDIGGKGINVSRVLKNLNVETFCIGFNYAANGYKLENELQNCGIDFKFIMADGMIRTNIKIYDEKNKKPVMTEINENGGLILKEQAELLYDAVYAALDKTDILVLSGSVPPGIGDDIYADFIKYAKAKKVVTVLDAEKKLFTNALKIKPDIIKPNLYELESAFKVKLETTKQIVDFSREIINNGVKVICVSLGKDGAIIIDKQNTYYAPGMNIDVRGLTGAGDSMVAGICYALVKNMNTENTLRAAMAAAAGSVEKFGTDLCDMSAFEKYFKEVEIVCPDLNAVGDYKSKQSSGMGMF